LLYVKENFSGKTLVVHPPGAISLTRVGCSICTKCTWMVLGQGWWLPQFGAD